MKTYFVYTYDKVTKNMKEVIDRGLTEEQAQSICDAWGWNYCDENGDSYWIDYEGEEL